MEAMEDMLFLPLDVLENSGGFSLDIGGTLAKIAYVPNSSPTGVKIPEGMGVVSLTSFPKRHADSIVTFLSQNCKFNRASFDDVISVEATGIGVNAIRRKLCQGLNIRLDIKAEFDLSMRTFALMRRLNPDTVCYPECTDAIRQGNETVAGIIKYQREAMALARAERGESEAGDVIAPETGPGCEGESGAQTAQADDETLSQKDDVSHKPGNDTLYPFMMVLIGSGAILTKVNSPTDFEILDIVTRAGRFFHGLCSLLSGREHISEILALADMGDNRSVDMFTDEHKADDAEDDQGFYSTIPDNVLGVSFGKTCGKTVGDFSAADLCRSVLVTTCLDLAQLIHHIALRRQLRQVYMGGMFVEPELVRRELSKQLVLQGFDTDICLGKIKPLEFGFIKYAGFLGAIGGLIPCDFHRKSP